MSRKLKIGALSMVAGLLGLTAAGFMQPASAYGDDDDWGRHDFRRFEHNQRRAFRNNIRYNTYYGATVHPNMYNVYPNYGYTYYPRYHRNSGLVGGVLDFLF